MDYTKVFEPNSDRTKPIIRGTDVTLNTVLEKLSEGHSIEDIIKTYPQLTNDNIRDCLLYASQIVEESCIKTYKEWKAKADNFRKLKDKPFIFKDSDGKEIDFSKL